jgi:caa(3)-type oxidase subunit IV
MSASHTANGGHGHHDSHGDHGHGALQMGHHHVSSASMFGSVLIALLILTIITVGVSRIDFGAANMLIAMFIASIKASLVIAFFMHVKWDTAINKIVFLSSFLFLSLLFIFTLADQATRRLDHEAHATKTPVDKQWMHPKQLPAGKQ